MSTTIALFEGKMAVLDIGEDDAATASLAAGSGSGEHRRISIRGSVFRMVVSGKQVAENEERAMEVVVVRAAAATNRQYYAGTYEEGVVTSPICFSQDGVAPDSTALTPQGSTCAACPQNIAGSGQGESRACRYQHRLAVVLGGDLEGPIYQLAIPATSLFGKGEANSTKLPLKAYASYLRQNNAAITSLVTEMRFDTKSSTPKLTFRAVRPLTREEYAIIQTQGASDEAKQAVTLSVFQQDTADTTAFESAPTVKPVAKVVAPTPAPKPVAKPVAKPQVIVEEEAEEEVEAEVEVEAPAPRVAPKAHSAQPVQGKTPVSAIIDSWDD